MSIVATREDGVRLAPLEVWHREEFAAHLDRAHDHIRGWVGDGFLTTTEPGARATLQHYADDAARDGRRLFGVWDDGRLVGGVMFVHFDAVQGVAELGCWSEPAGEGRGLIGWASRQLIDWAFDVRGLARLEWRCRSDNVRSAALAQRLGMRLEGVLRSAWLNDGARHDKQVWALLADER
ncbi:GNAT family N-acetyltransferase [Nocardioides sp.]|uniref:GNAT family N-acetyltransferase n=1 Tax=Nocardioides sp. TaxID=35761 RepID=UPI003516A2B7